MIEIAATLFLLAALSAITVIDLRSLRIPDGLSLPLIPAGLVVTGLGQTGAMADHLIGAVAGFVVLAGIGQVYFSRRGVEGLGLGDAKLFAAAGAWLGWQALPTVLLIAALGGLVFAALFRRGGTLAFGPWLALGFAFLWLWPGLAGFPFR